MRQVDLDLFEPFDGLIEIKVLGRRLEVPDNNCLLRSLQYVAGEAIAYGRFCWNDECGNCEVSCRVPGKDGVKKVRGCQVLAEEGMEIVGLSTDLDLIFQG